VFSREAGSIRRWRGGFRLLAIVVGIFGASVAQSANAQTDYYNTDAGRPVRIEDAYPTERYAFELQLAPVRLERARGGIYAWGVEPEIAYGMLPRTHLEIGVPVAHLDLPAGDSRTGVAGIEISALHNLNTETTGLPAFALAAQAILPVGEFGPDAVFPSVTALVTRTFPGIRVHANGQYTLGDEDDAGASLELSRWLAGVAIDRALPLRSTLITAEAFAEQPLDEEADLVWTVGAGVRKQRTPRLAIDAGFGRRLTGDEQEWYVTAGATYAFSIRALMPGGGR